jgi:hypothetical protein
VNDPCYDIGGSAPPIGIKVKDPICGILRAIQVVSFQYLEVSIKNTRFKPQLSTPMQAFASMRSTPFMEINDNGGEIVQDMKALGEKWTKISKTWGRTRIWTWTWTWTKREQH